MANIVELKDMADVLGVLITMDSSKQLAITVQYQGKVYKFKDYQDGLYHNDTVADDSISDATNKYNATITTYFFLSTV